MKEHLDERAMKQYTEMLIEQLQQMKESNWEKPWFSSNSFIIPQNINGRTYSGSNVLMLMFHKQKHDYQLPVYMTWQQAGNMGLAINKGEKSFPISLWNRIIKDENGKRISDQEYNNLSESEQEKCKVIPLQKYFNVFNVEQSNIKTAKPELWDALVKKLQTPAKQMDESNMVKNPALDKMLEDQSWICPIYQEPDSDKACFHKGNDEITVPEKKQFIDGESFYGTLLHEMIHSTGTEERLNRDMSGHFGSVPYAREELVAELGSAMAAINFGINKSIKDESKEYIKSWLDAMQQDPKFLMSVIGDIAKAVDFVNKNIPEIEVAENVEEQQPLESEQSRQEQLNSEEKTEIREKTDEELNNEAYERESEAIDSGHKAHFIAAWKEGEPNNGTFYEVWLKDEDIQNEDGISKYRELPLWNIESMKTAFNIADTYYNKEEMDAAWDEKFAGLAKDFSGLTKPVKAVEQQAEVKETEQVSGEEKEESRLDLFQKIVDDTLQGKQVNMPYEVYELLESMTDSELQQAKAIAEKRKGRSNTVKVNMSDIRIKVEQQMKTRADDRNPEQAEKRGYEQTMKSMRDSGTLFMARFDFESYIKRQKTDEEMMVQKNHPGAAAAHQGVIRAAQEYEKILDREIEMLNKATLQHDEMKEQHPDAILLLRTGNSYMIMREDAQAASQVTDLQPKRYPLTKGEQPKEFLAVEFPVSKLDTYLPQMVRAGVRVAICDGIDTPKVSKRQEQETNLDKLQEIIDSTLQGNELPDTLKNLTREMSDDELSKGISMIEENSGSGKKVQENIKTLYSTFRSETEERILNSNLKEAEQKGYEKALADFNAQPKLLKHSFRYDEFISRHEAEMERYKMDNRPGRVAEQQGIIRAAEEMKAKYSQSTGEKSTQEVAPKLKYFYSGNGISLSEEGDKSYTAFITQDREIKLYKEFHPDNLQKIKQMAETGNMLFRNGNASSDKGYLVLDPVNKPSKIYENPATMDRYFLSIEHVDGKEVATIGRTVFMDEKDEIDKLMDYTPENMAILEKKADDLLETKTQELKNALRGGDSATIQSASYSYMWASKYKLQQYYNPSKCKEEIKKIQDSIILQKDNKMETTEKKEMKDGISVFKMQNGQYGINETKDGVRTPTRRLHEEDVKAYFEGLKGQTKEEVNRRREVLAEKYLRGNQQAQLVEQTPKKQLEPLSPEHRERLTNASVFKMQDGVSYGVRTQIDGQQHSAKRVKREDIAAFFDGYKGLPKEQQDERKAQLAGMYFKEELTTPKQELSHGMHR